MNHLAIFKIYPQAAVIDGTNVRDAQGNQVTIDMDAVNAWVDPDQYKYNRAASYPSIADQLDTIYHSGIDAWKATITAVKEEFPK